jgi:hypothetical protein
MNTDQLIYETLSREVPLRSELEPAWEDVLARVATPPSRIGRLRRRVPTSRWALAAALVAVGGLSLGGFALADALGPSHPWKLDVDASTLGGPSGISTCNLIGKPAGQVAATLASNGIGIEWRYTHWGTAVASTSAAPEATTPQQQAEVAAQGAAQDVHAAEAVTGGSSDAVSSVPDDSVVWDMVPDGQTKAFVFVQAPNDPSAPTVSTDNCGG